MIKRWRWFQMKKNSKDSIVEAAIYLFNTKGFTGTTIRDIAQKANSNVSNISYYFQNKHGLLEYCFLKYFEAYIAELESAFLCIDQGAKATLQKMAESIINYHTENMQLTRLILREMSIDSQTVREIMSTYFAKEKYYFKAVIEEGIITGEFRQVSVAFTIVQLKSLLSMPFLNTHYLSEVLHVFPHEPYFTQKYIGEINNWIEGVLTPHHPKELVF